MHSDGRLQSDHGVRARRLIHACEPTMNPIRDQPSERRAALYGWPGGGGFSPGIAHRDTHYERDPGPRLKEEASGT